jgi:hypothetical protein
MDRDPATGAEEQILARKFLRHFVGDIHQPLHASDDHDRGGNSKRVSAVAFGQGIFIATGTLSSSGGLGRTHGRSPPI